MTEPLLEVKQLTLDFNLADKKMRALDDISFSIGKGEVVGVAGESGCGKSTLALSVMRLLPKSASIKQGEIIFEGTDLLKSSESFLEKKIRGQKISMIFQNPQNALNPVFSVQTQMMDILKFQAKNQKKVIPPKSELLKQAIQQLKATNIADPAERISNYPFEFSGGMKQRVMISMALSSGTALLIADEPTTALDVTIEAQILKLLAELTKQYQASVLYISHNLGVLSEISDRIMIMYAGRVFEMGKTEKMFQSPRHPYSSALLESLPSKHKKGERLLSLPGHVPSLDQLPTGCAFHPRCPFSEERCTTETPKLVQVETDHWSACLLDQSRGRQKWQWT